MKMDVKCLTKMLCALKKREPRYNDENDVVADNEYLLYQVLIPLMEEGQISLSSIDFDAFDLDDIRSMAYYAGYWGYSVPLVCHLAEEISQASSKTTAARGFC